MVVRTKLTTPFLDAVSRTAIEHPNVKALNEFTQTLQADFEREFGKEAFNKYYLGKVSVPVHEDYQYHEQDGEIHITAKAPKWKKRDFDIHFPHEIIADELGINFVSLHAPKFRPYFMAAAMHQLTGEQIYDELAGDLLEEVIDGIQSNIRNGHDPLTQKKYGPLTDTEIGIVIDALSSAIDCMVQHRRPDSLKKSDLLPRDKDPEPPPV